MRKRRRGGRGGEAERRGGTDVLANHACRSPPVKELTLSANWCCWASIGLARPLRGHQGAPCGYVRSLEAACEFGAASRRPRCGTALAGAEKFQGGKQPPIKVCSIGGRQGGHGMRDIGLYRLRSGRLAQDSLCIHGWRSGHGQPQAGPGKPGDTTSWARGSATSLPIRLATKAGMATSWVSLSASPPLQRRTPTVPVERSSLPPPYGFPSLREVQP